MKRCIVSKLSHSHSCMHACLVATFVAKPLASRVINLCINLFVFDMDDYVFATPVFCLRHVQLGLDNVS